MRRIAIAVLLLTVAIALLPVAALAKGASEATISGPGLDEPLVLSGEGQAGGEVLMEIAAEAGFFPAVFATVPDPMLEERPTGTLGPKYRVTYVMPGPNGEEDTLSQDLYPYATPTPVSYVEPGQRFWSTEQTRGGWYVSSPVLKDQLVAVGLPATAPTTGSPSDSPWTVLTPVLVLVAAAGLGALAIVATRRRLHPA